ncbi:MAG: AAA family ATPase [Akkermansia sp.]
MKIDSIKIKNFKAFKDVEIKKLPSLCVFVGANGVGKSTLFSLFDFLKTAFTSSVTVALNKMGGVRGIEEVRSRKSSGPIEIQLKFREAEGKPLVTYELVFSALNGKAIIKREVLQYRRGNHGKPWKFLDFSEGHGIAITNEAALLDSRDGTLQEERSEQSLKSPDILAIKGLSQFSDFPVVEALGNLIENWHISNINIEQARQEPTMDYSEHLSAKGDNLALVLQYYKEYQPEVLETIIKQFQESIPGMDSITPLTTEDGKVLLKLKDGSFDLPFLAKYVSDGTIKMLAYLTLLNAPLHPPLLCVEEPENQLYVELLFKLAEQFRLYAGEKGQVFVSTHSPDFLNALRPEEVFLISKKDGYSTISCLGDDSQIVQFCKDGDLLGYLWKEGLFSRGTH